MHNIQYIYLNSEGNKKSKCMHRHIKQSCTTSNQQAVYNIYLINAINLKTCFYERWNVSKMVKESNNRNNDLNFPVPYLLIIAEKLYPLTAC